MFENKQSTNKARVNSANDTIGRRDRSGIAEINQSK